MSSQQQHIPESIGRYEILRLLGSGAMGDVYLAVDPHIDRRLAVKTVRVVGGTELDIAERKQRLLREAKAAGKLLHPNVVALFDAAEADGTLYLAFEFVDGVDLAKRAVSDPPLTLRQVLQIGLEVATALDFAHRMEIVHRDIKPSNILLGPGGEAKVADFGIAKLTGSTELTRTGSVVGSPQYMSPEQVRGEALDGRSDLFSLGVVLYELLCRIRPFTGDTISTLVFEILAKEPPTVDQLRPGLPSRLVALVHRLLAKDRQHRPHRGADVTTEIEAILAETPPAQLDGPAGPPDAGEGETIRMPSSGGVPHPSPTPTATAPPPLPPLPSSAPSSPPPPARSRPVQPPQPTATLATGPAAGTPSSPPPNQPAVPAESSAGRPTPIDTGSYGRPGRGSRWLLGAVAFLAVAALGFFGVRFMMQPDDGNPTSQAEMSQAAPKSTSTQPSETSSDADDGADDASDAPRAAVEEPAATGESAAGDETPADAPSSSGSPEQTPDASQAPPPPSPSSPAAAARPVTRPPPPATAPPPSASSPARRPPPETAPSVEESAPATEPASPPPPPRSPQASPAKTEAEAEFDAEAAEAYREIDSGTRFRFEVEPEETLVKIQKRGDRSIVQGQVVRFQADEDDARDLELPGQGEYLLTLVHQGYPDIVYHVHAGASPTPYVIRLSMADAARRSREPGGSASVRTSRAVSFAGEPADAVIYVDGRRRGSASEFPGGGGLFKMRNAMKLRRGRHKIRIEAPGHEPHEVNVIVTDQARENIFEIVYRLEKSE